MRKGSSPPNCLLESLHSSDSLVSMIHVGMDLEDKQFAIWKYVSSLEEYCFISIPIVNLQSECHKYLGCFSG